MGFFDVEIKLFPPKTQHSEIDPRFVLSKGSDLRRCMFSALKLRPPETLGREGREGASINNWFGSENGDHRRTCQKRPRFFFGEKRCALFPALEHFLTNLLS